ncbi:MAG: hypothetical protein HWN81_16175 [Candidatus Lokiarchaeota archaeon]|nr:hypothetical protein [Candidatus Lokiarchaeota archaeon]
MVLNWTFEGIVDFVVATILLIASILSYLEPKTKKIKSVFFIRLGIFLMAMFFYVDGMTILFLNEIFSRINAIILFLSITFLIIGVNYIVTESFNSIGLIVICCLGALICYLAFQPGTVEKIIQRGNLNINWVGIFEIMGNLVQIMGVIVLFIWGLRTWLGAPFLIKREALLFFIGILITGPGSLILYWFYYLNPIFIIYSNLMMGFGSLIYIIVISKEPKLLYILPFTIHRIAVKDRDGSPLFDHDWTELHIDEKIFTGFLNAVQLMSEEVMNVGGLLDIHLEKGILVLNESKMITVGLIASKSSKLLWECVLQFTQDFEQKFERELKKSVKDISQYEGAFELIEKYFSNFPYKIIKSKKQPLLLTGKSAKIPLEIENKLKSIFTDEKEYETIKTEFLKSPLGLSSEFFTLYNNLMDETKRISEEKTRYLNDDTNLDK